MPIYLKQNLTTENEDESLLNEQNAANKDREIKLFKRNLSINKTSAATAAGFGKNSSKDLHPTSAETYRKLEDPNQIEQVRTDDDDIKTSVNIVRESDLKYPKNHRGGGVAGVSDKSTSLKRKLSLTAFITPKKKYSTINAEESAFGTSSLKGLPVVKFDENEEKFKTQKPPSPPPPLPKERYRKRVGIPVQDPFIKKSKMSSIFDRRYQTDQSVNGYISATAAASSSSSRVSSSQQHNNEDSSLAAATTTSASSSALPPPILPLNHFQGGLSSSSGSSSSSASQMATLCNIGNTCYLNSVVYTLRFAPLFLHNLHHLVDDLAFIQQSIQRHKGTKTSSLGRNVNSISSGGGSVDSGRSWSIKDLATTTSSNTTTTDNDSVTFHKSSQQNATEKLHELYKSMHRNEVHDNSEPHHSDTFLHAIQKVSSIFEGNQQQDAHEFLMCVLDNIRETCQLLIKEIFNYPEIFFNVTPTLNRESQSETTATTQSVDGAQTTMQNTTYPSGSSSSISSGSSIIKNISRKFKKKEDNSAKLLRLNSPLKETATAATNSSSNSSSSQNNVQESSSTASSSAVDSVDSGFVSTNLKLTPTPTPTPEEESTAISLNDKERLTERIKNLGLDFFSEDFEGITVATTKCLSCETVTEQKETMIDIAVPVPSSGYDCADYTQDYFFQKSCITREYFRGENKYRCEQCMGYTEAIRSISYEVLPRLLVIQLSRFSGGMEKINSYIPTPFKLQCFCSKCCELSDNNKLHVYNLYSVITHVGATMSVGHYIAYTCSLDWAKEYQNCPKDKLKKQQQQQQHQQQQQNQQQDTQMQQPVERNVGKFKKIFSRNKTSSSSDMNKMSSSAVSNGPTITNGMEKLQQTQQQNPICPGIKCCSIELKNTVTNTSQSTHNGYNGGVGGGGGGYEDNNGDFSPYHNGMGGGGHSGANASTGQNRSEPVWYMCDDDKIKMMSQREFEELLSPNRKITITPYLLFYARSDLQ